MNEAQLNEAIRSAACVYDHGLSGNISSVAAISAYTAGAKAWLEVGIALGEAKALAENSSMMATQLLVEAARDIAESKRKNARELIQKLSGGGES